MTQTMNINVWTYIHIYAGLKHEVLKFLTGLPLLLLILSNESVTKDSFSLPTRIHMLYLFSINSNTNEAIVLQNVRVRVD